MRAGAYLGDSSEAIGHCELATPGSLTLGVARAARAVTTAISRLVTNCPELEGAPRHIQCGLAGSLEPTRLGQFMAHWPDQPIAVVTDGYGQLVAATGGVAGACLSVGTGSVVHWLQADGYSGMAGGWGFPAGDLGGGAQLGLRWVQLELIELDRNGPSALLRELVGSTRSAIQQWCASATATEYAALCPSIVAAVDNGAAQQAVSQARLELDGLVAAVPAGLTCYVAGSLGIALLGGDERFAVSTGLALDGLRRIQLGQAPEENML